VRLADDIAVCANFSIKCAMRNAAVIDHVAGHVATIRAFALIPLVRAIDRGAGNADMLLANHDLLRSHLDDPYSLIPLARYIGFFEQAAAALSDPIMGIRVGMAMVPADLGPVGVLFSLAPTLSSAFDRLAKHLQSLQDATQAGLRQDRHVSAWSYRIDDAAIWPRIQDAEYTIATACQMVRLAVGKQWNPIEVHFEHDEPGRRVSLEHYFGAPVMFSQPANRILMATADIERRTQVENRSLTLVLERHVADLLTERQSALSLSTRVRRLITLYLGRERITVERFAKDLGLSARTLQRGLAGEGTSLRILLRDYRQSMAELRIGVGATSNVQIADALGYADGTVFWRAFKGWTGISPREFHGKAAGAEATKGKPAA
jgi:AraC-like DNA-binding protein